MERRKGEEAEDDRSRAGRLLDSSRRVLESRFGHERFLPGQEEALLSALSGRNLLVVMPTGSGKSLIYQLPALVDEGLTIVVSPLISLMKDQVDELRRSGIPATAVNSSISLEEQRARLTGCLQGEYRLLYIAPERCRNRAFLSTIRKATVSRLAVDEAHCISEWGHDFRPDYRRLGEFHEYLGRPPLSALTATATARVQRDIIESLGVPPSEVDVHVHGFDRPNLSLSVVSAFNDEKKLEFLRRFLEENDGAGIIYAGTRKNTEELAAALESVEPSVITYHAGMEPAERTAAQEAFLGGEARVVAATSAFGMGIDKSDVRFVVHFNYPGSVEQYYQEIGRAGRDGLQASCVLLYSSADRELRQYFIDVSYPDRPLVESVYHAVWALPENPVLLTYKDIGRLCDVYVSEAQVGAAVRMLDSAGALKAFTGEPSVAVTLSHPFAEIRPLVKGPMQRRVIEAFASTADLEQPGRFEAGLYRLADDAGVSPDQARRALGALDEAGLVRYEPPFRGRGIEKPAGGPAPFESLPIDWARHAKLRAIEEERLAAMERLINQRGCRRGFILAYFGETDSLACGSCDYCLCSDPGERGQRSVTTSQPEIALPVLVCLRFMRFNIGMGRLADVVRGSRNKQLLEWKLDGNPAYGTVRAPKDDVMLVIERLIMEGYIDRETKEGFPVLELTGQGKEYALNLTRERFEAAVTARDLEPGPSGSAAGGRTGRASGPRGPRKRASSTPEPEIRARALHCIDSAPFKMGVTKIAAVLTGSRAAWMNGTGVNELAAYGSVDATQQSVREVIQVLLDDGLLTQGGSPERPTLRLTDRGRQELGESPPI